MSMGILLKGKGVCEHCGKPVVIFQQVLEITDDGHAVYDIQVVCDPQRFFLIMDGVDTKDHNMLTGRNILSGELVYGRRATAEKREQYRETGRIGGPYTIVVRPHYATRPAQDGRWVPGCTARSIIPTRLPLCGAEPGQEQHNPYPTTSQKPIIQEEMSYE